MSEQDEALPDQTSDDTDRGWGDDVAGQPDQDGVDSGSARGPDHESSDGNSGRQPDPESGWDSNDERLRRDRPPHW